MPRQRVYKVGSIFPWPSTNEYERQIWNQIDTTRDSTIPGAGKGAFAKVDFEEGIDLGPYRGVVISQEEYNAMTDERRSYVVTMHRADQSDFLVDAWEPANKNAQYPTSNWTRFMNDPYNTNLKPNVRLTWEGRFVTLCPIKAGCELFFSYGEDYWEDEDVLEIVHVPTDARCQCGAH